MIKPVLFRNILNKEISLQTLLKKIPNFGYCVIQNNGETRR